VVDEVIVGRDLRRVYVTGAGDVVALDAVGVVARRGELTAVAGPSGSGKSTLARIVGCVERPDGGELVFDGAPVQDAPTAERRALRRHRLSVLAAEPLANLLARFDVAGNVRAMARWRSVEVDVDEALAEVGLEGRGDAALSHLSGGEQQRLAVAVAAVGTPLALVADEPTAELDTGSGALVIETLTGLAASGTAVLVATHDAAVLAAASTVVRLDHGRVVA
jgi:putative ABC transport system ATP-binding protein